MSRFRVSTYVTPGGTRGQQVEVSFIDDDGKEHAIKNCKALQFSANSRHEPVELKLTLVGPIEIDIQTEIAATIIKEDSGNQFMKK